jgi:cell division septal protein FtsQ
MAARKATPSGRPKNAQQDFLSKPPKRRKRPAVGNQPSPWLAGSQGRRGVRQHRQEQAQPGGVRASNHKPARTLPRIPVLRVAAGVLLIGLMALLGFLFSDADFYVETAAIRGLRYTTPEQIYRQAGIDQYSIFWIDARKTAQRIETLPYVKRATVHTALPNQVHIEVEEREPLVVWKVGDQEHWVDGDGVTMPVAGQMQNLPVLWDLDGSTMAADGRLDRQLIASLQQVKQQAPEVTDFGYDRTNGLQFRFADGAFVYLGHPEGLASRVASLLVLHQSLASQGQAPAQIDWRFENGYYLRLAQ